MALTSPAKGLIVFTLAAALVGLSWQPTRAQSKSGKIVISPAFQEVNLTDQVASLSASIELHNQSQSPLTFSLEAVEIQQFDAQGNVSLELKPVDGQTPNLASFISLPQTEVSVASGQKKLIPVTVQNSVGLSPGGHYAALIARLQSSATTNQVLTALSAFILVHKVGGEQFNLSLIDTSFSKQIWWNIPKTIELTFSNQGNVHLIPRGSITVNDAFGRLVAQGTINENSFYVFPSTQRQLIQPLHPSAIAIPFIPLQFAVTGSSQPGEVTFSQTGWVLFWPPFSWGLFTVIVFLIGFCLYRLRQYAKKQT